MKRMLITSLAGFTLISLGGCSQMGGSSPSGYSGAQPALRVTAAGVDELYARGRQAQATGQRRRAAEEFRRVLEVDPRHLEATNGLAVVYAEAGQTDESLSLFRRAIELAPEAAHVHNNYGYALYRLGRLDEAEQALQAARRLDPGHARTQQNLALVSEARGRLAAVAPKEIPAALPVATAAAPAAAIAANPAATVPALPVAAIAVPVTAIATVAAPAVSAGGAPQLSGSADPGLTLVAVEPQVYQLRDERVAARGTAVVGNAALPGPVVVPRTAAPLDFAEIVSDGDKALVALRFTPRQLGLEVANGVGVAGLARRTAKQLGRAGLPAVRLTNVARYQESTTVIQYRQGHEAAAQALGGALPIKVASVGSEGLRFDINVRLVLGHDTAGRILAGIEPLPVLAQTKTDSIVAHSGWRWS